jgi:D-threo-aldose 1-dehydrogenase
MVKVPELGLGGASLGDLYCKISSEQALNTVTTAYDCGVRYFDTSPWYGLGLSEQRMGLALHDKPRDTYILQSKVGRYLVPDPKVKP